MLVKTYRPKTFQELIGQDVLVKTITNAFKLNRIPTGFLLSGPRGTGKTTTARLIAKALNCKDGPSTDFNPQDSICQSIDKGTFPDVQEMDAASHTGVDDMRQLIEGSIYRPLEGRYKVYILDEVHMLSKSAFNALLKTLEEPPDHVIFIFATTEIEKVPLTITSRCQSHYLHFVTAQTLTNYIEQILEKEQYASETEALRLIANVSEGSVRDALSLVDQALALGNRRVTTDVVNEMLGGLSRETLYKLFKMLYLGQRSIFPILESLLNTVDPVVLIDQLLEITSWITKLKVHQDHFMALAPTETDKLLGCELLSIVNIGKLSRLWQALLKGRGDLLVANNAVTALFMVCIRILYISDLPTPKQLLSTLTQQEESQKPIENKSFDSTQDIKFSKTSTISETLVPKNIPYDDQPSNKQDNSKKLSSHTDKPKDQKDVNKTSSINLKQHPLEQHQLEQHSLEQHTDTPPYPNHTDLSAEKTSVPPEDNKDSILKRIQKTIPKARPIKDNEP